MFKDIKDSTVKSLKAYLKELSKAYKKEKSVTNTELRNYVMNSLDKIGGIPLVMKKLLDKNLIHGDSLTVTGKTIKENLEEEKEKFKKFLAHDHDQEKKMLVEFMDFVTDHFKKYKDSSYKRLSSTDCEDLDITYQEVVALNKDDHIFENVRILICPSDSSSSLTYDGICYTGRGETYETAIFYLHSGKDSKQDCNDIEGLIIGSELSLSSTLQLELAYDDKDRKGLEDEYYVKLMFVYPPKEGPTLGDGISSDMWRENKDMTGELLTKVKRNNKIMVEFDGNATISRTD